MQSYTNSDEYRKKLSEKVLSNDKNLVWNSISIVITSLSPRRLELLSYACQGHPPCVFSIQEQNICKIRRE
jgi:hypothetical protein